MYKNIKLIVIASFFLLGQSESLMAQEYSTELTPLFFVGHESARNIFPGLFYAGIDNHLMVCVGGGFCRKFIVPSFGIILENNELQVWANGLGLHSSFACSYPAILTAAIAYASYKGFRALRNKAYVAKQDTNMQLTASADSSKSA